MTVTPTSWQPPDPSPPDTRRDWLLLALALIAIIGITLLAPGGLLDKADKVGYAVCHRITIRSFLIGERQMPLCARCTGQYLGAVAGLLYLLLRGRARASELPSPSVLTVLLLFLGIWAFDGVNSYLTLFPGMPHLYEPHNILRVSTGLLQGFAVVSLVWPVFNLTAWAQPDPQRSLDHVGELASLVGIGALLVLALQSEVEAILLPLAIVSSLGTVLMLTLVLTVMVLLVLRRANRATRWRHLLMPLAAGLATSLTLIALIDSARASRTRALGLPF